MWRTVNDDILLSSLVPGDRDSLVEHLADKEISDVTSLIPHPYTLAHADAFIAWTAADAKRVGTTTVWAIREREGKLIGCVGLHDVKPMLDVIFEDPREGSLGYWLAKPFRGRGIMAATVAKVCEVGFYEMELDKIYAVVKRGNAPSEKVLERCGFVLDTELPAHFVRDGVTTDGLRYRKEPG